MDVPQLIHYFEMLYVGVSHKNGLGFTDEHAHCNAIIHLVGMGSLKFNKESDHFQGREQCPSYNQRIWSTRGYIYIICITITLL